MDKIEFKNDWFAINALNPEVTMDALIANNMNSENTGIKPKDYYLEIPKVKEVFSKEDGSFDQELFDKSYNDALKSYAEFATIDQNKWLQETYEKHMFDINRTPEDKIKSYDYKIERATNPFETSNFFYKGGEGPRTESIAELAQKNKYFDTKNGVWADKSPNELWSTGVLLNDTLVLAQYDEDGTHIDKEGNIKYHVKGDYKLNDDGKFYYETANGRPTNNKQVLGAMDVLTTDGSLFNKIDFFDQDDITVPVYKSTARTIAFALPYLIPGFGQYYALATAAMALTEAMPSIIKTFNGLLDSDYIPSNTLNKFENFTKKFETTKSEYAKEHQWAFDNICTFVSDSFSQLFQQRAIANIPKYLGFDKRLEEGVAAVQKLSLKKAAEKGLIGQDDLLQLAKGKISSRVKTIMESMPEFKQAYDLYNNYTKYSTALSRAYLVATSASNVYNDAINLDFNARQASLISLGTMLSFDALFRTDYFKSFLLTGSMVDDDAMALRQLTYGYLKTLGKEQLPKVEAQKGAIGVVKKIRDKSAEWLNDVLYGGKHSIVTAALSEGVEETIEEVATDVNKMIFGNGLNAIREQLGYSTQGNFDYTQSKPFERYLTSFIGGAIGGSVFGAETAFRENYRWDVKKGWFTKKPISDNVWNNLMTNKVELSSTLVKKINSGKVDEIINFANKMRDMPFASKSLTFEKDSEGNFTAASNKDESQNNVIIDSFINYVTQLDRFLEQEGIRYSDNDSTDKNVYRSLTALSYLNDLNLSLGANKDERKYLDIVSQDLNQLQLKLFDLKSQITAIADKTNNPQFDALNTEYSVMKQRYKNLRDGKTEDVFGMILANSNPLFSKFLASNVESYSKIIFHKDYSTLNDTWKEIVDSHYKKYVDSGQNKKDSWFAYQLYSESAKKITKPLNDSIGLTKNIHSNAITTVINPETLELEYSPTAALFGTGLTYADLGSLVLEAIDAVSKDDDEIVKSIEDQDPSWNRLYNFTSNYNIDLNVLIKSIIDYIFEKYNSIKSGKLYGKYQNINGENGVKFGYGVSLNTKDIHDKMPIEREDPDNEFSLYLDSIYAKIQQLVTESLESNEALKYSGFKNILNTLQFIFEDLKTAESDIIEVNNLNSIIDALGIEHYNTLLIEIEKAKKDSNNYTLDSNIEKLLDKTVESLEFLATLIKGAENINRDIFSLTTVNGVINKFRSDNQIDVEKLAEIDSNTATDYNNQIWNAIQTYKALKKLSKLNASKENKNERILSVHIKRKIRDDVYKKLNELSFESKPHFEIEDFDDDLDTLNDDKLEEQDLKLEQTQIANEQKLYTFYKDLSKEDKELFIQELQKLYPDFFKESEFLTKDPIPQNAWTHPDVFPFWYIVCNVLTDTSVFYDSYKKILNDADLSFAPYYSQDLLVKLAFQFISANKSDVELILNEIKVLDNDLFDRLKKSGLYVSSNIFRISAGAGVGKTMAVTPLLIKLLKDRNKDTKLVYSAPKQQHLDKLADSDRKLTFTQLFDKIKSEVQIKVDGEILPKENIDFKKVFKEDQNQPLQVKDDLEITVLEKSALHEMLKDSLLIIDEGTHLTQFQYAILDLLANMWNFKIVTMGDILQTGKVHNFDHVLSVLGPSLYASKRAESSIVKYNQTVLNNYVLNSNEKNSLHFSVTPKDYIVGVKINDAKLTQESTNGIINALPNDKNVLVFTKNGDLSFDQENITVGRDITVIQDILDAQGGTFDFVIVDQDLTEAALGEDSRQFINTILSRNKLGTIVFGKCDLTSKEIPFENVVPVSLNEAAIKEYGEYRMKQINNLNWDVQKAIKQDGVVEVNEDVEIVSDEVDSTDDAVEDAVVLENDNKTNDNLPEAKFLKELEINIEESKTIQPKKQNEKTVEVVRMYSFHNRLGGKIEQHNKKQIFSSDLENEDLTAIIEDKSKLESGIDVHSKEFIDALTKLNIWKNQLLLNLESQRKLPKELEDGQYFVKITRYNPDYDDMYWKEDYDEELSKIKILKRVIYKLKDGREITVLTFPNSTKLFDANSDSEKLFITYINNMTLHGKQKEKYFEINTENIKFVAPHRPLYFAPRSKNKSHAIHEKFSVKFKPNSSGGVVSLPSNFSFMQLTRPVRIHSTFLKTKHPELGDKSLNVIYSDIDSLYRQLSSMFDSIISNEKYKNPFKQRNGHIKQISKIKANGTIQTFAYLNFGQTIKFTDVFKNYMSDLVSLNKFLNDQLSVLNEISKKKDEKERTLALKRFVENSDYRITVQPLTVYDIYDQSNDSSEERFKKDVKQWFKDKGSKHFGKTLTGLLWTYYNEFRNKGKINEMPTWLLNIGSSAFKEDLLLEAIEKGASNINIFKTDSQDKMMDDIATWSWIAFKSLYLANGNINPTYEKKYVNKTAESKLYPRVYKYYYNPSFNKNANWDFINEESTFVSDSQFAYERGWSSLILTGDDVNKVFTEYKPIIPKTKETPKKAESAKRVSKKAVASKKTKDIEDTVIIESKKEKSTDESIKQVIEVQTPSTPVVTNQYNNNFDTFTKSLSDTGDDEWKGYENELRTVFDMTTNERKSWEECQKTLETRGLNDEEIEYLKELIDKKDDFC